MQAEHDTGIAQTEPIENWRLPPNHKSVYTAAITERLVAMGRDESSTDAGSIDPRHVEAYMRLEHPTLDGLTRAQFTREVKISVECIDQSTTSENEALAASFGL